MNNNGSAYTTAEAQLRENGVYMSNTIGHSMEPFLCHHRDAVVISRPMGKIKKYDVVLYRGKPGSYILHRVISVKGDNLVIRGDNTFVKEYKTASDVVGVLTSFVRDGKRGEVTDRGYRFYSRFWNFIYPLRAALRAVRLFLGRLKRKLFGSKK